MYCPSCGHRLESSVERCDRCGFHLGIVDLRYGAEEVVLDQVTDATHFLRGHDKERLSDAIDAFETQFPQFFPIFYVAELSAGTRLTEFAAWLLNRGRVPTVDGFRDNASAYLVVIDLTSRSMTVVAGYSAEPFVSENDLRELLSDVAPYIDAGDLATGLEKMLGGLRGVLRRNHTLVVRSAQWTSSSTEEADVKPSPRAGGDEAADRGGSSGVPDQLPSGADRKPGAFYP